MAWVSKEQIEAAREMSAIEYLKRYEAKRLKKSSARNEWELADHDSFKINEITSAWHWKSRDIGGYSALNFLTKVNGMDFVEAVEFLSGQNPSYLPPVQPKEQQPIVFELPPKAQTCDKVRHYLKNRGISDAAITYCIQKGILYESLPYHNAVFVGYDEKKQPKYAFLRGTYDQNGKSFKMEQRGSEKSCSFLIPPKKDSVRVAVYEAAIDAMAHMTLEGEQVDKYRLSLGGISAPKEGSVHRSYKKPSALERFLTNHPEITEIEICTDNDFAGRWVCEQLKKAYGAYNIIENLPQAEGADYGDLAAAAAKATKENKKSKKKNQPER